MPIKQEKMNRITLLAFKKLQCAILLEHFHQQSLENLVHLDKQKVIHRALFYLTLELMLFDYAEPSRDNWNYINGDKYARTFIIARTNIDPAAALSLTSPQLIFLLYPYINDYDIDLKIKAHLQSEITLLSGYRGEDALPWRPSKEWIPGVIFSYYRQETIVTSPPQDGCCGTTAEPLAPNRADKKDAK